MTSLAILWAKFRAFTSKQFSDIKKTRPEDEKSKQRQRAQRKIQNVEFRRMQEEGG
jgi:hypothetical protein